MAINEKDILDIVLREGYVSQEDFDKALHREKKGNASALDYLLENNVLSLDLVGQAMAEYYGVPYADLNTNEVSSEQVLRIPEKMAKKLNAVLYKETNDSVVIATSDPSNPEIKEKLVWIFNTKKIKLAYSMYVDIEKAFSYYKENLADRFTNIIQSENKVAPEMVLEILKDALNRSASDVHFEPMKEKVSIRFRVDGVLQEVGEVTPQYYQNIINHLKISASLKIDEHKTTQDGALHFYINKTELNLRISIVPIVEGEKIVLRILSRQSSSLGLENLGLSQKDQEIFETTIRRPFGMIIISGPTGSGKSTTLYSLLTKINNSEINITSIEDPVEYIIHGANQIQVNLDSNITFARGLRSIVRQDPDVIFVGEIRDSETADISVNAALTGHFLFSTFHANNAESTFLRLMDMGVERFLLASTLNLVVSQRLLRKLCEKCRYSKEVTSEYASQFPVEFSKYLKGLKNIYQGKGCSVCRGTGYKGRIAAFQLIQVTPEIQTLILRSATSQEIWDVAKKQGARSLFEDAQDKANLGITSYEEIFRVTPPTVE
ncbi:MAG: Flp pilus assembly complex ATPase component TadA [Candidatus Moraniibacteriota bacterium]|nr:MAG: Flp pilus assembly complex ATPase component TadA [Candidatus Moranbacteria bacterium]